MARTEFVASSMREALQKAKEVLGEDAYIIESKETKDGVRIYATTEDDLKVSQEPQQTIRPITRSKMQELKNNFFENNNPIEIIKFVVDICQVCGISRDFCDAWLDLIADDLRKESFFLDDSFSNMLRFEDDWIYNLSAKTPVILVGTPGVGKTSILGKLAVALKSIKKNIVVVTLDTQKAGALEQLKTYISPLNIPIETGFEGYIKAKEQALTKDQIILVDTPGINILSDEGQGYYFRLSQKIRDPLTLVLSNDLNPLMMKEIAQEFCGYNAKYLIGTRFDLVDSIGSFINTSYTSRLSPVLYSCSAKLKIPLKIISPRSLLNIMTNKI